MSDPVAIKARFRAEAMARRDAMSRQERAAASARIAERAWPIIADRAPACVSLYWPIRSECDVRPLILRLRRGGIDIALPAKSGDVFVFRRWAEDEPLHSAPFGLSEPAATAAAVNPDFIVLPMVGFDRFGNRLGYGKGHYDRAIAALRSEGYRPGLLGVAFAVQEVPAVPAQPYDVRLDWVVTEHGVLRFE